MQEMNYLDGYVKVPRLQSIPTLERLASTTWTPKKISALSNLPMNTLLMMIKIPKASKVMVLYALLISISYLIILFTRTLLIITSLPMVRELIYPPLYGMSRISAKATPKIFSILFHLLIMQGDVGCPRLSYQRTAIKSSPKEPRLCNLSFPYTLALLVF